MNFKSIVTGTLRPVGAFGIPGAARAGAAQACLLGRHPAGVRQLPRGAVELDRPLGARREERRRRQHVPDLPRRRHGAPQGSDEGEAAQPVRQGPHGQRTDGGLPHLPLGQPQSRVLELRQAPAQRRDVRELPQHPRRKAAPELHRAESAGQVADDQQVHDDVPAQPGGDLLAVPPADPRGELQAVASPDHRRQGQVLRLPQRRTARSRRRC